MTVRTMKAVKMSLYFSLYLSSLYTFSFLLHKLTGPDSRALKADTFYIAVFWELGKILQIVPHVSWDGEAHKC